MQDTRQRGLTPRLYQQLVKLFGTVRIANEGQEASLKPSVVLTTQPRSLMGGRQPQATSTFKNVLKDGEYYRCCCPFCGDSRYRLWISYLYGEHPEAAYCYNETECLRLEANRLQLRLMLFSTRAKVNIPHLPGRPAPDARESYPVPGDIWPIDQLPEDHEAVRYLRDDRGFTDLARLSRDYGVGFCVGVNDYNHGSLVGRIYIPMFMDGLLKTWQGRYPDELNWKESGIPKYFNLPGAPRAGVIYNFDLANRYDDMVLVEGAMDVWSVGAQGAGVLSCKLTPAQRLRLMNRRNRGSLAIVLDGEATEDGLADEVREMLEPLFDQRVFVVPLSRGADPGSLPSEYLHDLILTQASRLGLPFSLTPGVS